MPRLSRLFSASPKAYVCKQHEAGADPRSFIDLGDLLLDENRNEEAVSYLLQAIEVAPHESRAHELLGKAYSRLEQLPKAQTELEKAIELSSQKANLHCMLAPVYRKQALPTKQKLNSTAARLWREATLSPPTPPAMKASRVSEQLLHGVPA